MDVLVFTSEGDLSLACVAADDRDALAADAIARGWLYAGSIAVDSAGQPKVQIEPGFAATMVCAGAIHIDMLARSGKGVN